MKEDNKERKASFGCASNPVMVIIDQQYWRKSLGKCVVNVDLYGRVCLFVPLRIGPVQR